MRPYAKCRTDTRAMVMIDGGIPPFHLQDTIELPNVLPLSWDVVPGNRPSTQELALLKQDRGSYVPASSHISMTLMVCQIFWICVDPFCYPLPLPILNLNQCAHFLAPLVIDLPIQSTLRRRYLWFPRVSTFGWSLLASNVYPSQICAMSLSI